MGELSVRQARPWQGRNKPHRGDRRWVQAWSPEQISNRLRVDFPADESMRISHEAIYQALYVVGPRSAAARTGGVPAQRARLAGPTGPGPPEGLGARHTRCDDQPAPRQTSRTAPSPDTGKATCSSACSRSAIGTLVERTTRFTLLIHLPREEGFGVIPRTKNGPALAGYGAITMKDALAASMTTPPEQLRRSLTWDRGKELSAHAAFTVETNIPVYFADPKSPWQHGTNENTNGLLRHYFPKGTDLSRWTAEEINAVAVLRLSSTRKWC